MIPARIERYVQRMETQSSDAMDKKAKRLRNYAWLFLGLLLVMLVGYGSDLLSGKKSFSWNEAVALTLPFLTLSLIMAMCRDTLLVIVCMRNKRGS